MPSIPDYSWPSNEPWIRAAMVMSLDGSVVDHHGRSAGVSSPEDHEFFLGMRRTSDVVLVGAGTVRAESYKGSRVPIAIVSNSGHLPADLPLLAGANDDQPRPILYTSSDAARRLAPNPRVDVTRAGEDHVSIRRVIADLAERGLVRITCEGGPRLLGALVDAGLLDELRVSVVARFTGTQTPLVPTGTAGRRLRLVGAHREGLTAFLTFLAGDSSSSRS